MVEPHADPWNSIAGRSRQAAGVARQMPRRQAESEVRRRVATLCDDLAGRRCPRCRVARDLRLSSRTLLRWRRRLGSLRGTLPRGRPCKESSFARRRAVLEMLNQQGQHLGLPTLRAEFPDMPRCELGELQTAYRRHYQATHRRTVARLAWHGPGCVWATDHLTPPSPIDGEDHAVLAVRDLASGVELAWQPVSDQTTDAAAAVLKVLFDRHGPPLVLKSDNGSAFISEDFRQMLTDREVAWLPSPPRTPWYNGSCEAGNGSMRTRTDHFAKTTGGWTSESMEAARRQANELTRPQGHLGPTPTQLWAAHLPIDPQQRKQFLACVERHRAEIVAERKNDLNLKNKNHQRQVQRQAVRRALLDCGLLTITRRSVSPPLNPKKRDKIS